MASRSKLIRVVLSIALTSLLVAQERAPAQQQLFPVNANDRAAGDEFGISVAIGATHVLVGADGNQDAGLVTLRVDVERDDAVRGDEGAGEAPGACWSAGRDGADPRAGFGD